MANTAFTNPGLSSTEVRVLVVEDENHDVAVATAVRGALEAESYRVEVAVGAVDALRRFILDPPALVLLRTGHDDGQWVDLCRQMHELADVPIVIGFRLEPHTGAIAAFKLGVAGYISDPGRLHELVARVRATLRNVAGATNYSVMRSVTAPIAPGEIRFATGDLFTDFVGRKVTLAGRPVHLTRLEFDLLKLLLSPPGQVHTRHDIITQLWGPRQLSDSRTLDTHIRRLRLKLEVRGASYRFITVRGVGFRFDTGESQGS